MARQLFLPATATLLLSFFLSFFFSTPPPPSSPPPPLQLGRQGATIASRLIPVARVPLPLLCLASRPPPVLDPLHKMTTATAAGSSQEKAAAAAGGSVADRIMPHLLNIYGSSATARDFEIYAANATFEDPLMRAHGVKQIKSAFYTLPKVFGESKITEYTVQENPMGPGKTEVVIQNKQHYKVLGKPVDLTSLIRLQLQDGKVVKHEDWWHGKPLKNRDTVALPLVGRLAEASRRGAMLLTHALMGFGKDPTQPPPPPPPPPPPSL